MTPEQKQEYIKKIEFLRENPDRFITDMIGDKSLEDYHKKICKTIVEYDRVAIPACHAVGKTWILGRIGLWFNSCFKNSIVITTAPTNRQVETLLWGEIRKAHRTSKTDLGGKLLRKKLEQDDDWYMMGFSPATSAGSDSEQQQGSSFQGFHAKYVMIIFDEATGIPKDLYTMAEGLLTSGVIVKWVCIANPTTRACEFFKITKLADWKVLKINCFDSPNMIANGFTSVEKIQEEINYLKTLSDFERLRRIKSYKKPNDFLLNAQWAIAKLFQWGFDHPLSKSKILGEFPTSSDNVVVKYDSVQNAFNREPNFDDYRIRSIGVDVARYGDDLTVLTEITDETVREKYTYLHLDTNETTGHVVNLFLLGDTGQETHIVVDATGVGAGVVDNLKEMKRFNELPKHVFIHEVHFGQRVYLNNKAESDKSEKQKENEKILNKRFENLKAYLFDKLNEDLREELSLSPQEVYEEELPTILFKVARSGKFCIESKEDYKARTGKSPDVSDSLALANFGRYMRPSHTQFTRSTNMTSSTVSTKINKMKGYKPKPRRIRGKEL